MRAAVVVVTGQPTGSHGLASVRGAGETVVLSAPGIMLEEGGIYRVDGRYQPLDPVVRDYYATQGAHLELRATEAVRIGRRGGVWGAADTMHRAALGGSELRPTRRRRARSSPGSHSATPARSRRDEGRAAVERALPPGCGQRPERGARDRLHARLPGRGRRDRRPRPAGGACGDARYVLVTGAGPSIVRAGVAGALVAVAWLGSRSVSRWHLLACGAAVVLALDPLELFDPGFQLSFSAVVAIFVVAPRLRGLLGQAAAVSVACTVVTAPIVWWHFGRASPLASPPTCSRSRRGADPVARAGGDARPYAVWPPLAAAARPCRRPGRLRARGGARLLVSGRAHSAGRLPAIGCSIGPPSRKSSIEPQ